MTRTPTSPSHAGTRSTPRHWSTSSPPHFDPVVATGLLVNLPVSHYLGGLATVLGRYDEADAYFAKVAAVNDRANAKCFAARTNLSWDDAHRTQRSESQRTGSRPPHQGADRRRSRIRQHRRRAVDALEHLY